MPKDEEFREAGTLLTLLIIAIAFIFLNSVFAHAIIALEKQKYEFMVWIIIKIFWDLNLD